MMEKRILGRTGEALSVLGFGGIIVQDVSPDQAAEFVRQAVARGINYFDVAPAYGNAEERLGRALEPYRDDIFLACKTGKRTAQAAEQELRNSLKLLRTDHIDLHQFHAVSSVAEAEEILAPGGALEFFVKARERGLIRYIGFSAHSEAAAQHLLKAFSFDSMLLPVNIYSWQEGGFGSRALQIARERGTGILALKVLAKRPLRQGEKKKWTKCWYVPIDTMDEARQALQFTLSQPVTAVVCPGHAELLWLACDALAELGDDSVPDETPTITQGEPLFMAAEVDGIAPDR